MWAQLPSPWWQEDPGSTGITKYSYFQYVCVTELYLSHFTYNFISDLSRAGGGTNSHKAKHTCNVNNYKLSKCPSLYDPWSWITTDEEMVKFGCRLAWSRKGLSLDRTISRYKEAWNNLYPNQEVPLNSNGMPMDFLWDETYPCPLVPWFQHIPPSETLTGN